MSLAILKRRTAAPPTQGFTGLWHTVAWQPDLFTPQTFVVGVLVEGGGARALRLMDGPGRLECFFRPHPVDREFRWLMAAARQALARGEPPGAHNLTLSPGLHVAGESAEAVADRLFIETVLAAAPGPENGKSAPVGPDTEAVRRSVSDHLKRLMGLDFERVAREAGETLSDHHLDVTLAPTRGAGSVVSACYRAPTSLELNLLRASTDIAAYAAALGKPSRALFLQLPGAEAPLSPRERRAIEQTAGEEAWKLECAGFMVRQRPDAAALAADIRDWALPLLA